MSIAILLPLTLKRGESSKSLGENLQQLLKSLGDDGEY
jgi:hypothetical protein